MAHYVDGFVVPVPTRNLDAYRQMAERAGKIWKEHGALQYVECIADDVKPGKVTSFPQAVQLKDDETVTLSVLVQADRIWVGLSRVNEFQEIPKKGDEHDWEKFETTLKEHKASAFFESMAEASSPAAPKRS